MSLTIPDPGTLAGYPSCILEDQPVGGATSGQTHTQATVYRLAEPPPLQDIVHFNFRRGWLYHRSLRCEDHWRIVGHAAPGENMAPLKKSSV